jgi:SAM-dependent methyltransferase
MRDLLDRIDAWLSSLGLLPKASWRAVTSGKVSKLYAGRISRNLPQFRTHLGITPFAPSSRNIDHDARVPMPIPNNSVEVYQSEDVFEHIPYRDLPTVFDEIFRVLKPGGLFRLSLPDYGCDLLARRTQRDAAGNFLFDPSGGGRLFDGQVIEGGHVWFPTYARVRALFDQSRFAQGGRVDFLHYTSEDGQVVMRAIDYSKGYVGRTPDHDGRSPHQPLSIVVDAVKL